MKKSISIFWFRQDLRISDNPGFLEASKLGSVMPIYIFDDCAPEKFKIGQASKIYLGNSLESLNKTLKNKLNFYCGDSQKIILDLVKKYEIWNVFWNRCFEPWILEKDSKIEEKLKSIGAECKIYNRSYLINPEEIKTATNSYYKIFGAFKRKVLTHNFDKPVPAPKILNLIKDSDNKTTLSDLNLCKDKLWQEKVKNEWSFGEKAAQKKLYKFIKIKLSGYEKYRNFPGYNHISKLSPNLHLGEISPHQIVDKLSNPKKLDAKKSDIDCFVGEIIWREFANYLMFHFKELHSNNFVEKFDNFPWKYDEKLLQAWKTGQTGYPLIDAGMRELSQTGFMHNRVRMVVASFLVKNLMIHWHTGRDWFWDCLVDADLASNSFNWQWIAGCGVDPTPYFRIFNPTLQGDKFDKDGLYTRKFVPELQNMPNKYLFKPWKAPEKILLSAGIKLGTDYPKPIISLEASRNRALAAFKSI